MKDFFIKSFEMLVALFAVLLCLGVVVAAGIAMFTPGVGFLPGLLILIGGGLYTILLCGIMYLYLGTYQNTKRTAEAVEKLLEK